MLQGKPAIVVHPDVAKALRERRAVVALESTIISHGMPWPQNLQTASEVEDIVWQGTFSLMRSCCHRLCVLQVAAAIRRTYGAGGGGRCAARCVASCSRNSPKRFADTSHGMPYPQNPQTAQEVKDVVRQSTFFFWDRVLTDFASWK